MAFRRGRKKMAMPKFMIHDKERESEASAGTP